MADELVWSATWRAAELAAINPNNRKAAWRPCKKVLHDDQIVTVRVPISIRRRGGRKLVLAPDAAAVTAAPVTRHMDNVAEIADSEKINDSYVGRVLHC